MKRLAFSAIFCLFAFAMASLESSEVKTPEKQPSKIKFRSGYVLAAEISSQAQTILNLNNLEPSNVIKNKLYAALFAKLDKGRSIGIYDYVLSDGNAEYQCVGIKTSSNELCDNSKWEYNGADDKVFMMIFIVNGPLAKDKPAKYTLKSKLFDNAANPVIEFKNIGAASFSNPQSIPPEGVMGTAPAAKPATPPAAAPAAAKPAAPPTAAPAKK